MNQRMAGGTAYEIAGKGPLVVLVHGMGLNRAMWQWLLPDLVTRFQVVTYDLMNHGQSAAAPLGQPDLRSFNRQIVALLDHLGQARCALVGFSLGGMIARRFALDHPERLSALAILNSAHDRSPAERAAVRQRVEAVAKAGPASTVEAALARWFSDDFQAARPELIELVRRWVTANPKKLYTPIYRVLAEGDAELAETIGAIRCPTLVMTGADDPGNSPDMARRMAAAIPGAACEILPGLRHMGLAEDPAAFNAPLLGFLESALSPPAAGAPRGS